MTARAVSCGLVESCTLLGLVFIKTLSIGLVLAKALVVYPDGACAGKGPRVLHAAGH